MIKTITTKQLAKIFSSGTHQILDCRPSAAYNGWKLQGESRGGHIPNAYSFPFSWFESLGGVKSIDILKSKGLNPEKPVIITGYVSEEIESLAENLHDSGFSSLSIHTETMHVWASDPQRPLDFLPGYKHLIYPGWLHQLLEGKNSETGTIGRYILAHVNFDNWGDYDQGHIPGAIWLDTLILEDELTWNSRSSDELEEELCNHGITKDTTVILYGRTSNPNMTQEHPGKQAGHLASMRAVLLLMYSGVSDVRILDGGLDAWLSAGYSITKDESLPAPVRSTGMHIPEHPEYIIDTPKAKQYIADRNSELVSMRSWEEFTGEVSGYHYINKSGRIPGAIFGNNGSDAYNMENYRNHDNTMRNYNEITSMWNDMGITPEKNIAFYCGTGWRASEAFFYAWLMGWKNIAVYDGGWYEWSADPNNPINTGIPENSPKITEAPK